MSADHGDDPPIRRRQRTVAPRGTVARPGSISVQRTNYHSGQVVSDVSEDGELLDVPVFVTDPAYVEVQGSITRNMGDFNSVRIQVSLSMPALPEMSEVERVYAMASAWVEERLESEMSLANETRVPTEGERQLARR